ncbi:MarR family transcriptional regulator [Amycolatopsis keratiniphila]|uniref:MarR family transcriptional regulator n=1 Tax=Amycolatopsis keratiniphila TaxID=129921 RepID=UPI00087D0065|nr:MarR family transcriptional regulator [Amycolatopsis keratiniphila]OLZ61834.1 MarR family transcriptional regulator [Amycolatopsis keratiniphila subsp. nogabecina]SDU14859.1 DNA-binding transcriptional regulator, MarR family [Amycolatopsis keratiniphila]
MAEDAGQVTDDLLVLLLRQLTVEADRFAEMFGEKHGLHRTDLNALAVIMDAARMGAPMSPSTLASALHLSASATTAVLDRLERAGHVHRDRSATDRRKVELRMHEKAREIGAEFFLPLGKRYAEAWREMGEDERRTVVRFLRGTIAATVEVRGRLAP